MKIIEYETMNDLAESINALPAAQRVELNARLASSRLSAIKEQGWKKWLIRAAAAVAGAAMSALCLTSCELSPAGMNRLRALDAFLHTVPIFTEAPAAQK